MHKQACSGHNQTKISLESNILKQKLNSCVLIMRTENSLEEKKHNHHGKYARKTKSRKTTNSMDRRGGNITADEPS
jgi:hypothetical protein